MSTVIKLAADSVDSQLHNDFYAQRAATMISPVVEQYLQAKGVSFELIEHEAGLSLHQLVEQNLVPGEQLVRMVLLQHKGSCLMTVLPFPNLLDFRELCEHTDLELGVMSADGANRLLKGCHPFTRPAFPGCFGIEALVDPKVFKHDQVYVDAGSGSALLKINSDDFKSLMEAYPQFEFSCGPEKLYLTLDAIGAASNVRDQFTPRRIKQRIEETLDLPAMPEVAKNIMRLRVDPSADAEKLAQVIMKDPSLAAQIISWARSPYYGYPGDVDSLETAIARVLGFELVMNLALGISISKSFTIPTEGPLGLRAFWKQAVYSAHLCERLFKLVPKPTQLERGLVYLSGLLHNFGHLLLGHLFAPQFYLINRYIEVNPNVPVQDIEQFVLGVSHAEMGAWLMQNWHMPEELIVAVRRHHQEEFWSKHCGYSNLVMLANRLLMRESIGDSRSSLLPASTLENFGFTEEQAIIELVNLLEGRDHLDAMYKEMVA